MPTTLVIVESPAKCPKLKQILGAGYEVLASCGHLLDVPASLSWMRKDGVLSPDDVPYDIIASKKVHVARLRKAAKAAGEVLIASDMDREGEAIGFHICSVLKLDPSKVKRILFDQITPEAILGAVNSPVGMRTEMYRAQQARRVVDLLFGYSISPHLWHIAPKLSAGRCQSPALAWMCERQKEFMSFQAGASHFEVAAKLIPELAAKLKCEGEHDHEAATEQLGMLKRLARWVIATEKRSESKQHAPPAFTTSAMQQACNRKWKWAPQHTMSVAQKLYEAGHITYMRTDCTRLSDTFVKQASEAVTCLFGAEYLSPPPSMSDQQGGGGVPTKRGSKPKKKGAAAAHAQEAHEPIRPVNVKKQHVAESECAHADAAKLYRLIYCQAMSSIMAPCVSNVHAFELHSERGGEAGGEAGGEMVLLATWIGVQFAGFRIWEYDQKEGGNAPPFACPYKVGDGFDAAQYVANEKFPPRPRPYTAGDMVKLLEEKGVGRPSTYSSILERLLSRGYVDNAKSAWGRAMDRLEIPEARHITIDMLAKPEPAQSCKTVACLTKADLHSRYFVTELGERVCAHLQANFGGLLGCELTTKLESELDDIAHGQAAFQEVVEPYRASMKALAAPAASDPNAKRRTLGNEGGGVYYALATKNGDAVAFFPDDSKTAKPTFASLPEGTTKTTVTLEQAKSQLQGQESGGHVVATMEDGEPVYAKEGKYGKYLRCETAKRGVLTCKFKEDVAIGQLDSATALAWLNERPSGVLRQVDAVYSIRSKDGSKYIMKKQGAAVSFASLNADVDISKLTTADCKAIVESKETMAKAKINPKSKFTRKPPRKH